MVCLLQDLAAMDRIIKYIWLLLLVSACAKPGGFNATEYDYVPAEAPKTEKAVPQAAKSSLSKIVRNSKKITFSPTASDWNEKNVTIKANVKINDESLGEIEFKGVQQDSRILLSPVQPEIGDKLKAQLICTSDEGTCSEFFVDVFYKENETLYHDQVLAQPKVKTEKSAAVPASAERKETKSSEPAKSNASRDASKGVNIDSRRHGSPAAPNPAPIVEEPSENLIQDEVAEVEVNENAGYIGTPDEEAFNFFKSESDSQNKTETPKKDEPVNTGEKGKSEDKSEPVTNTNKNPVLKLLEKFRATDQAIGYPNKGRLERGTNLFEIAQIPELGFSMKPAGPKEVKDYFGTFALAQTVALLAQDLKNIMPDRTMQLTSVSKWGGGKLRPHASHQNGTDVDIRYLRHDEAKGSNVFVNGRLSSNFLVSKQWQLFKKAFATNNVELILVDPAIKRALCEEARRANDFKVGDSTGPGAQILKRLYIDKSGGHRDHFHLRVKCTGHRCRPMDYKEPKVGC